MLFNALLTVGCYNNTDMSQLGSVLAATGFEGETGIISFDANYERRVQLAHVLELRSRGPTTAFVIEGSNVIRLDPITRVPTQSTVQVLPNYVR